MSETQSPSVSEDAPVRRKGGRPKGTRTEPQRQFLRLQRLRAERLAAVYFPDAGEMRPATISIRDFAIASGLSQATVMRRVKDGTFPSTKIGQRRLISYSALERLRLGE